MKRDRRHATGPPTTRRDFLRKAAYVAPTVLTLPAVLSIASAGSGDGGNGPKPSPPPAPGGSRDRDGGCDEWWHIFFCFPPWDGNRF